MLRSRAVDCLLSRKATAVKVGVAAVTATTLLAACSSSHKSAGTTGSNSASTATSSLSTLHVTYLASEQSPTASTFDDSKTVSVWQKWTNSHGGIGGHPVSVTVLDDKSDAGTSLANARQALADTSSIALINDDTYEQTWANLVPAANTAVICAVVSTNGFQCSTTINMFPTGSTVDTILYAIVDAAAQFKGPDAKFGLVFDSSNPASAQGATFFSKAAGAVGIKDVYQVGASEGQVNYTAICLAAQHAGADAVYGYGGQPGIAKQCAQQGYNPLWIQSQTFTESLRTNPAYDGTAGPVGQFPWFVDTSPGTHEFREAMTPYGWPNLSSFQNPTAVTGTWAALETFKAAAVKALATNPNPTRQDILNAMYQLNGSTINGLTPPLNYVQGKPTHEPCFYDVKIESEKYVAPYGLKTTCAPASWKPFG
jgi:branched-chain amino acid transport system substrate-binding protein